MKAAIYDGKSVSIRERDIPKISDSEVLIKVKAAGICGTDLAIIKGNLPASTPIILGHEFSGEVIKIGKNVEQSLLNKRVTSEINSNIDFSCYFCKRKLYTQCVSRKALGIDIDGAFAEYIKVPWYLVHEIPDNLTYVDATFIEPLAAAYQIFELMPLEEHDKVATIFGLGKLGLLITQVALEKGLKIIAIDGSPIKLNLAKKWADQVINRSEIKNIPDKVKKLTNGIGSDIVIDATGNIKALPNILSSCRTRGKIHIKSTPGVPFKVNLTDIVVREITLFTSRCGPFKRAIEGLSSGKIDVKHLVTARYPPEKINLAFNSYEKRDHIKSIIIFE